MTNDKALHVLQDLVSIDSMNPMGGAYNASRAVEAGVNDYVTAFFEQYDVAVERDRFSERHENLYVRLGGAADGGATLMEAHADTVPADDWTDRALRPRRSGGRLIGRGAADAKGSLTGMMLALSSILDDRITPPLPVLLMCAGDEEFAQSGIKHFMSTDPQLRRAVIGEPTSLEPIVQHKGAVRWDIVVYGRSAHSSRPELGANAIDAAIDVIQAMRALESDLQRGHVSSLMTGPTLTVTMINGGRTCSAVPDECTIAVDYRILPGQSPESAQNEVIGFLARLPHEISHQPAQMMVPPLATNPAEPFPQAVLARCREGRFDAALRGAPYGSDACWLSSRVPCVVLGPGSIDNAHAVDEFVEISEVVRAAEVYRDVMLFSI